MEQVLVMMGKVLTLGGWSVGGTICMVQSENGYIPVCDTVQWREM